MVTRKEIGLCIVLSIITCGIYGLYWMATVNDDSLKLTGENGSSGGMVVVLTIITCGIYGIYWAYILGKRIDKITGNIDGYSHILYLVLQLFSLGIISLALAQNEINAKAAQ